jgi:hypothetical protein
MRNAILIFCITSLIFSCQNEENLSVMDWEQQIIKMISDYDKNTQLDYSKTIVEDNQEIEFLVFEKSSEGVYKIIGESNFGGVIPLKMVYYLENNKVLATKFTGLSPYIHKGQKRAKDKCCAMFENIKYFKSNVEVISLKKKLDLMTTEEFDSKSIEFDLIDFIKSEVDNPKEEYERTMNSFQELKEKLNL